MWDFGNGTEEMSVVIGSTTAKEGPRFISDFMSSSTTCVPNKVLHRHLERPLEGKIMEAKEMRRLRPEIHCREELVDALKLIA
ncbi:hypothetical protein Y032_0732g1914 [Ancylostoma ceylanicum]|uniref:Uncharacterized protein n=1 Tax=Ancylostoma ceylanicum TaxID=53326 RepID=A0A016WF38_9BILA|nr:hypothetical protein Y032_0732g1914 [Ancylostoma ceylanicum]